MEFWGNLPRLPFLLVVSVPLLSRFGPSVRLWIGFLFREVGYLPSDRSFCLVTVDDLVVHEIICEHLGVEIKPEEAIKVDPGEDKYLHLSQASLGETKKDKGNENILVYVTFNNQKLVLGTLSADKCAQIQYDLVFEKEFEISHNSKNASVYLCGYKTVALEGAEYPFLFSLGKLIYLLLQSNAHVSGTL
ncbi:Histone deacetylase [Musa troglodytarum]|uniref:Histone deacetylase n=1 Tax=Musa troglodytarum TaxID=320322 RepID=A0A9E7HL12_9LILI|nr:Histone deacetylase [Musa troglodytarum]